MPIGNLDGGKTIVAPAEGVGVVTGTPVVLGDLVGVCLVSASDDEPGNATGNYYATIALEGEWDCVVGGSPTIGAAVYTSEAAQAGVAAAAELTVASGDHVFGHITGDLTEATHWLVRVAQAGTVGGS